MTIEDKQNSLAGLKTKVPCEKQVLSNNTIDEIVELGFIDGIAEEMNLKPYDKVLISYADQFGEIPSKSRTFDPIVVGPNWKLSPSKSYYLSGITYSQETSPTTDVNVGDDEFATILTQEMTTLAQGVTTFNVLSNSILDSNARVSLFINNYTGSGIPVLTVSGITEGQFSINVHNAHSTSALNGQIEILFRIYIKY